MIQFYVLGPGFAYVYDNHDEARGVADDFNARGIPTLIDAHAPDFETPAPRPIARAQPLRARLLSFARRHIP